MLRIVRTGLRRRHAVTLPAIKGDVDLQRFGEECAVPQLVEDVLRVEGAIVAANAGVVASDDQVRAAEILADKSMKQCLARPGVTHFNRIARLNYRFLTEIIVDHRLNSARTHLGRYIARLQLSKHLMDENTV